MMKVWSQFSLLGKGSVLVVSVFILLACLYLLSATDLHEVASDSALEPPSRSHPLGTDELGVDQLAKLAYGASISLSVGLLAGLLAGIGGSLIGLFAGYKGKTVDRFIMSMSDIILCIPNLIVIIIVSVFFSSNLLVIIATIVCLSWVGPARISRAKMLSLRNEKYVAVAKSYGVSFFYLLKTHFLPTLFPIMCMSFIRMASNGMTMEASLAFLGIGDPTVSSWGAMMNESLQIQSIYFTNYWQWLVLPPVICFIVLLLALAMIGRELENIMNEKLNAR